MPDINKKYEYVKKYLNDHQEARMLNVARQTAKRKNLEFNITLEDIIIPSICPFLGCKLTNIFGRGRVATNASIDRIDSTKGYIRGNIQVISDLANRMKQEATPSQLIEFAKGVLTIYDEV